MSTALFRHALPDSLRPDARDLRLPRAPAPGFRNMFHDAEAPEGDRWRGLGGAADTEMMLAAVAERIMGARPAPAPAPFPAGYTYLAQFVAHDLKFSTDEAFYPPTQVPMIPLRARRLTLETIYGEGPQKDPELYDDGYDALAPYRLAVGKFGPGAPVGQRTLSRRRHDGDFGDAPPLCAADPRNDENPVVAQIAGFFMRLHNVALRRLARHGDPAARFEAARRVTQAVFRRIVFADLAPMLLRDDVRSAYEAGRRLDRWAEESDDMPVEFTHAVFRAGHALVRPDYAIADAVNGGQAVNVRYMLRHTSRRDPDAFREGRAWALDWSRFFGPDAQDAQPFSPYVNVFLAEAPGLLAQDHPRARRAHLVLRDLARGMDSGPLRVQAIAEALRPAFTDQTGADLPGLERWLGFDASHRGRAVLDWIDRDRTLRGHAAALCADPPLYLFVLLEAAAAADQGGGAGRRYGAVGSSLLAEPLFAARDGSRARVEDHPDLACDLRAVFGDAPAPAAMAQLIAHLTHAA